MKPSLRAADSLFKPWFVPCHDTREGSGMDMVKVRHVKQTAPGTYEFREDGADSPILVWYTTASSMYQALSPQDLPQYFN
ncbi:hypothetical protein [Xenorhabdus griffiniae]|uniref:hypothetical protein n=1 Tax=Xenorhabdus griffiniae TaxID=351672 RepID=UPI002358D31D|nr:hypothetical protein [Xenorhabdus griffiniae]MDC9605273.1 hypothetical protein [Xenorhabdus griffiniae]